MKSKLDKLNELGELLQTGTISKEEFISLKNELLNPDSKSIENSKLNELDELLKSGAITQEEFNKLKSEFSSTGNETTEKPNLKELLESGKITQEEFNIQKNGLVESKTDKRKEVSTNKRPAGIDKELSDNEKRLLGIPSTKSNINVKSKNNNSIYVIGVVLVIMFVVIKGFLNSDESNGSIRQESNYQYNNSNSTNRENTHTCKICLSSKKESEMIRSSGDVLSGGNPYWICNGVTDNMRCINRRYKNVVEYNNTLRQEREYKKHSGTPDSPFR